METDYKVVMNDPWIWFFCVLAVAVAVIQAGLISKKALETAPIVGLSKEEGMKAFKSGMITAVGPALGSVVVMLSLMAYIGGAFAWLRLCFIGSAAAEMTAAGFGATAMGTTLGGEGYDVTAFANSMWACSLNALGWLVVAGIFTPRLQSIKAKIVGNDPKRLDVISTSAMVGAFSFMAVGEVGKGRDHLVMFLICSAVMVLLSTVGSKVKFIRENGLSIVLVVALLIGYVFVKIGFNIAP